MARCKSSYFDNNLNSICQKKCNCKRRKCHSPQKLVKDCICIDWSIKQGRMQTIFQNGGFRQVFASGLITFDYGNSDIIIVRAFLGNNQVGSSIEIFEDSSVAFSLTGFDRITVECPGFGVGLDDVCEGELCISTRVPVG